MNSSLSKHIGRFFILVLLQVLIFNHVNFLGYISPYVYILFILLYPITPNRLLFIFLGFVLGFTIDIFSDSGGVHAAASVSLAFARPLFLKFIFGFKYEYQTLKIEDVEFNKLIIYFGLATLFHHLILFTLEIFSLAHFIFLLKNVIFATIFTTFLCLLFTILFTKKHRNT